MEITLHAGNPARHKTAVLTDRIAAHWAFAFWHIAAKDLSEYLRAFFFIHRTFKASCNKSGFSMRFRIPSIHPVEHGLGLMNCHDRTFMKNVQILVRNDRSHLQDAIHLGLQPRHFHINPNEVVVGIGRIPFHGICARLCSHLRSNL